jgi:cell division protein FtsB
VKIKELFGRAFGWVNGPGRAISFAVLVVVLVFFGRDLVSALKVRSEIHELKNRKQALERTIAADSTLLRNLDDPDFLEKYARENYLMRYEHETVYVVLP